MTDVIKFSELGKSNGIADGYSRRGSLRCRGSFGFASRCEGAAVTPTSDIECSSRDVRFGQSRHFALGGNQHCYSITSSARCWSCTGTSRPSAWQPSC